MDKEKIVKDYLSRAKLRFLYCDLALKKEDFSYVFRECQAIAELCSKALLYNYGFHVPEEHDLKYYLDECKDLFSEEFKKDFNSFFKLLKSLRIERERSFYGDPENEIYPSELYTKDSTIDVLNKTKDFFKHIVRETNFKE